MWPEPGDQVPPPRLRASPRAAAVSPISPVPRSTLTQGMQLVSGLCQSQKTPPGTPAVCAPTPASPLPRAATEPGCRRRVAPDLEPVRSGAERGEEPCGREKPTDKRRWARSDRCAGGAWRPRPRTNKPRPQHARSPWPRPVALPRPPTPSGPRPDRRGPALDPTRRALPPAPPPPRPRPPIGPRLRHSARGPAPSARGSAFAPAPPLPREAPPRPHAPSRPARSLSRRALSPPLPH